MDSLICENVYENFINIIFIIICSLCVYLLSLKIKNFLIVHDIIYHYGNIEYTNGGISRRRISNIIDIIISIYGGITLSLIISLMLKY